MNGNLGLFSMLYNLIREFIFLQPKIYVEYAQLLMENPTGSYFTLYIRLIKAYGSTQYIAYFEFYPSKEKTVIKKCPKVVIPFKAIKLEDSEPIEVEILLDKDEVRLYKKIILITSTRKHCKMDKKNLKKYNEQCEKYIEYFSRMS